MLRQEFYSKYFNLNYKAIHEAEKSLQEEIGQDQKIKFWINGNSSFILLGPINATPRGLQLSQQNNLAEVIRIVHHDIAE
jgi:hypothetical protein